MAQPLPDDEDTRRALRLGPVSLFPSFDVSNIGVDSNVFNDRDDPKKDFTATINFGVEARLQMGRVQLAGTTGSNIVYFQKFKDERFAGRSYGGQVALELNRVNLSASADTSQTRNRLNSEIDARADRQGRTFSAGAGVTLTPTASIAFEARRAGQEFDVGETFRGVSLAVLNRTSDSVSSTFRYALTALTTVAVRTRVGQERFDDSPVRDAKSVRVAPFVEFSPDALLSGEASVGVLSFTTDSPLVPDYTGLVANVSLTYTLLELTSLGVELDRDIVYSFAPRDPFYLSTDLQLEITQRVFSRFDLVGTVGREWLDYRRIGGIGRGPRVDSYDTWGGGFGYRIGDNVRIGINGEFVRRRSSTNPSQEFGRSRVTTTVTYGQ